jgi:hypothetical protein
VDYEPAAHYWARWVLDNVPHLFDGFDRTQVGIDREELDEKRDILIGRITQFCVDNGL